jgi:hypothetical protein
MSGHLRIARIHYWIRTSRSDKSSCSAIAVVVHGIKTQMERSRPCWYLKYGFVNVSLGLGYSRAQDPGDVVAQPSNCNSDDRGATQLPARSSLSEARMS